jgi:nicotinate-nucleotide adenylyltransferase
MDPLPDGARRIAFFGGSFDPPHLGHLAVARAAQRALALDAVLFAPVGSQPLKPLGSTASFDDRLAMTRLAIAAEPAFAISLADAPSGSGGPNYTLEALLTLRAAMPAGGELFCLMGADSFLSLRRWHRAAEIPFAAPLIVASRPNKQLDDLAAALPAGVTIDPDAETAGSDRAVRSYRLRDSAGRSAPLYLLPELYEEVSATEVRERLASGQADSLLPVPVADYILRKHLYR